VEFDQERKIDFSDVLISPRPSSLNSRKDVLLTRTFEFPRSSTTWTVLPLMASNMDAIGTIAMAEALAEVEAVGSISKYIDHKALVRFFGRAASRHSFFSMGITAKEFERLMTVNRHVTIAKISIEVANGYIEGLSKFVAAVRQAFPMALILAGSVCTPEGTTNLLKAGADIARVGIGSGSVCITRRVTGVGYPQLSAVIECSEAAHDVGGFICSDGGCTVPGDICKALCAGADFVMLGGCWRDTTSARGASPTGVPARGGVRSAWNSTAWHRSSRKISTSGESQNMEQQRVSASSSRIAGQSLTPCRTYSEAFGR
jgi:GMP reductase